MKRSELLTAIQAVLDDHFVDDEDLANDMAVALQEEFSLLDEEDEDD